MSDQVKYLSGEWHALAGEALREQITPDKMKNISTSMSNIYKNCPDGKDRFLFVSLESGLVADFQVGEGAPPKGHTRRNCGTNPMVCRLRAVLSCSIIPGVGDRKCQRRHP